MPDYRVMQQEDVEAGLSLCRMIGWNQLAKDWELFLRVSPGDCRVAVIDNKVVGTVTTIKYQKAFCWIGMVLVNPECQKQGIGKQLLKEALAILQNEETIKLDATPAGREVYLKLDFVDEYKISRMKTIASADGLVEGIAVAVNENDLNEIAEFDKSVFGADRRFLLEWMWKGAPQYAFVIKDKGEIQGYCMGRTGFNFTDIGPIVAKDLNTAKQLASAALRNCIGKPVVIDGLKLHTEWMDWLQAIGFTEQRELIRMYKGKNNFPGIPQNQFSILGPEFG